MEFDEKQRDIKIGKILQSLGSKPVPNKDIIHLSDALGSKSIPHMCNDASNKILCFWEGEKIAEITAENGKFFIKGEIGKKYRDTFGECIPLSADEVVKIIGQYYANKGMTMVSESEADYEGK